MAKKPVVAPKSAKPDFTAMFGKKVPAKGKPAPKGKGMKPC